MQYTTSRLIAVIVAATVAASLVTGIVPAAVAGQSAPADPAFYNGNVVTDNGDAPVGTTIEVIADDGSTSGSITIQEAGEYGGGDDPTRSDERLQLPAPDGGSGTGVTFEVTPPGGDTTTATTTPSDVTFQPADVRQVDLDAGATSGVDTLSASFGTDPIQPGGSTTVTVTGTFTNGSDIDVTDNTEITTSDSNLVSISGNTISADSSIEQTTSAVINFNYEGATTTESITISPDTGDDGEQDPDDGSPGGGSPGGGAPGDDEDGEDEPPSVQDIRDTLNLVDTETEISTDITDANPDTAGTSVQPEETQSVQEINFNNEELTGTVDVTEYNSEQVQDISERVAESVTNQVENIRLHTDGELDDDRTVQPEPSEVNVIDVSDVTVTSDSDDPGEDTSATVTLSVDRDQVNNPQNLVVVKEGFNEEQQTERWSQLETTVQEVGNEQVTVTAQVPDFSLFAVAEIEAEEPQQVEDDGDDAEEPEAPDDDGPSPVVSVLVILLVLAAIGGGLYYYGQQSANGDGGGE